MLLNADHATNSPTKQPINGQACAQSSNSEALRLTSAKPAVKRSPRPEASTLSPEAAAVQRALIEQGLETPMVNTAPAAQVGNHPINDEEKYLRIKALMAEMMTVLGLDLSDDSLTETPHRIAKMYVKEIFSGLDYSNFPRLSVVENKMQVDEMVRVSDIKVTSTCEHHFVIIDGFASVAYIPKQHVIGLSKINRIVRFFAQRPQVQERLTRQILVALQTLLGTDDVAVSIQARHYCVIARGVEDATSNTATSAMGGVFKRDPERRREFLQNS